MLCVSSAITSGATRQYPTYAASCLTCRDPAGGHAKCRDPQELESQAVRQRGDRWRSSIKDGVRNTESTGREHLPDGRGPESGGEADTHWAGSTCTAQEVGGEDHSGPVCGLFRSPTCQRAHTAVAQPRRRPCRSDTSRGPGRLEEADTRFGHLASMLRHLHGRGCGRRTRSGEVTPSIHDNNRKGKH